MQSFGFLDPAKPSEVGILNQCPYKIFGFGGSLKELQKGDI